MQLSLADELDDLSSDEALITYNIMADQGESLFYRYGLFDRLVCDLIGGSIADDSAVIQPVVAIIVDLSDTACGGAGNWEASLRSAGEAIRALSSDSVFFVVGFAEHARLLLPPARATKGSKAFARLRLHNQPRMEGFGRYSLALARTRGVLATLRFDDLQIIVITSSENREHASLVNSELDFYKRLPGKLSWTHRSPVIIQDVLDGITEDIEGFDDVV